jgi:hypothetical protein
MHERDQIFRERLVALIEVLNSEDGKRKGLRNRIGAIAARMARDAGARDWADLKERADGPTYDSMLRLFQRESEAAQKAGDDRVVRTMEVLAISLIARRQAQADLVPGISFLDSFIEDSERAARRAGTKVLDHPGRKPN